MNSGRQTAIEYLRAPANGLWRWAENASVLVWRDGHTIAFKEEIGQIIECLAPNGLPAFGAIVFLLAACRGRVPQIGDLVLETNSLLPTGMGKDAVILLSARKQLKAQLEVALSRLSNLSKLPNELSAGIRPRCVLAEAVFESVKAERHVDARTVLRGMQEPLEDSDLIDQESVASSGVYLRQIHLLAEGLKPHTPETLALRLRTGLDALPQEIDANLPSAERARRLIDELSRDREYGALARAARDLMAAVRLPRRLGEPEQLAIGGVADITNRGPLDRLLLSELAHDDLTLTVRVALNEALYLRREPPLREPPGTLGLLLDSGVRLWGVPRVLATAVALAFIACDKRHSKVLAWRAHGKELQPLDLLSRPGLTQHLGALETSAHAGDAVPAFAKTISTESPNVSVLITHSDALADPAFRATLAGSSEAPSFVAAVNREGRFELHALPLARRPAVCEADLDLAKVFDEPAGVPPIKVEIDPELPAIFGLVPFPFLLPLAGKVDFWTEAPDGYTYAVLNDRRLVQFQSQHRGARVLASDLPAGGTIWMDVVEGTVHAVKVGSGQRPTRLLSITPPNGQIHITDLVIGADVKAVYRYGDVIVLIRGHDIRAYALSDGRLLGKAINPSFIWVNGRFFQDSKQFYFAVWNGESVKFEPVQLPTLILHTSVATIFDRPGREGPWIILRKGQIISIDSGEKIFFPVFAADELQFTATRISKNGDTVMVPRAGLHKSANKTLERAYQLKKNHDPNQMAVEIRSFEFDRPPAFPIWNLRRTVESIARLPDGLAIRGRKNRWWKLTFDGQGKLRMEMRPAGELGPLEEHPLAEHPVKTRHGCMLYSARLPTGSRAFLDSRGLLHLKSGARNMPEISLVLADGEVAGWTSDGFVCGPPFFFESSYNSDPRSVFERLLQFLNHL